MKLAAGHQFPAHGPCLCGQYWNNIRNVTAADLGQENIAHVGALNQNELASIEALRADEDRRIADANHAVLGGAPVSITDEVVAEK